MSLRDGETHEGFYVGGKKNGFGIMKNVFGQIYEGYFKNDLFDGSGKLLLPNGYLYEGDFKEGKKNGKPLRVNFKARGSSHLITGNFMKAKQKMIKVLVMGGNHVMTVRFTREID